MSFIHAHFFSDALQKQVQCYVLLPDAGRGPFPVLYLLHGRSDDHTIWHRRTRIEQLVREMPLAVVMPDGFRGFYTDNESGPAYARYLYEDVIGFVERTFPVARKRSGRCIGGLSMGGYGALRAALARPDLFTSAHSHSGALKAGHNPVRFASSQPGEDRLIFGARPAGSAHDLFAWAKKRKRTAARLPKLRIDCGVDDYLIEHNRAFHAHLEALKIPHEYHEFAGAHDWAYWDEHIGEALAFHARALKLKGHAQMIKGQR